MRAKPILKAALFLGMSVLLTACSLSGPVFPAAEKDIHEALCDAYRDVTPEYVFTYAENQSYDYPTVQGAVYFASLVHEKTQGRIQIRIYANAELGSEESIIDQIQFGGCDFMRASIATLSAYNPECNVLMMPYLYDSPDHMWEVLLGDVGDELMASFEPTKMLPLAWYDAGVRNFYSREPIASAKDLEGLRIRVQDSSLMEDLVRQLGASPVTSVFDDVYGMLETGSVDAAENNWNSYDSMEHYKVAPYYIEDGHTRIPELVLMSQVTADQLSDADLQIIRECARASTEKERDAWEEREKLSRTHVLEEGTQIVTFSEKEIEKLRTLAEPLYEEYCGEYMDLIDKIRNMR